MRPTPKPNLAYADTIPTRRIDPRSHSLTGNVREVMRETMPETKEAHFDRILREYGPGLSRLAFGYEKAPGAREEPTQEIVLAIWQALSHFRGECSERAEQASE